MKKIVKIITLIFTLVSGFFFLYQILLGNPFHDEIHPALVLGLFFIAGVFSMLLAWRRKKKGK